LNARLTDVAPLVSATGFTAGLRLSTQLPNIEDKKLHKRNKNHSALAFISSLVVVFILLSQLVQSLGEEKPIDGEKSSVKPPDNCYEMRIYALNYTERNSTGTGTLFRFDAQDLPFEFESLRFGDFREDTEYSSSYYAGIGLLADADGSNSTLTLREGNGNLIQEVAYHGQSLIALGGWESISRDNNGSVVDCSWGSMAIPAHDWKDGGWIPENGILIEHPTNVTIAKATIHVMVFEPASNTDIPEFTLLHASIVAGVLILLIRRRMTKQVASISIARPPEPSDQEH